MADEHRDTESDSERLRRLARALRRMDEVSTLSEILEALARGAAADARRVAILVVDSESQTLRSWGHYGFPAGQGPFDVPLATVRAATASAAGRRTTVIRMADVPDDPNLPAFMKPASGQAGVIAPIPVGGDVVAVLYAEGQAAGGRRAIWEDEVEIVVRHAAARLENVTAERTVAVLARMP